MQPFKLLIFLSKKQFGKHKNILNPYDHEFK